jgi:type IV secretion system protein VirB4
MRKLFKWHKSITQRSLVASREVSSSVFIPYLCHFNSSTILTKNRELIVVIKVDGFSFETADDEDVDSKKEMRNNMFKGMSNGNFIINTYTVRKKYSAFPDGSFDDLFCSYINDEWKERQAPEYTFVNEHYITITRKNNTINDFLEKVTKKFDKSEVEQGDDASLLDAYAEIAELRDRIVNSLTAYRPKVLGVYEKDGVHYSEILEFLGLIVNAGNKQKYFVPTNGIDRYIQNSRLYFGRKHIEIINAKGETKYGAMISLKNYRPTTHAGIFDKFLHLDCEFVISQSFSFIDKSIAINKMQLQQRRMIQSEDPSISQITEINQALDSAMAGEYSFGMHHLTVMCIANSKQKLDDVVSEINVEFINLGFQSVRESINMPASFWGQLPGNGDYIARKSIINTKNLASFQSFHNYPKGKISGNHWGDAVTVLNTTSGTPYFFNFHVRDVGHTMIVGPTGSGKTVLMNFLCAQAQKFKPKMFFFDKDRGSEIFIRAIGGSYSIVDASSATHFNPLMLPDTAENRAFLLEWFQVLITSNGEQITSQDISTINQVIEGNYRLPKNERRLCNVAPFFGIEGPDTIAGRLSQWHGDGVRAKLFDNENDMIDFTSLKVFGFEMGEILKDGVALPPALLYLFHRINQSLDGTNTMVILDEAWALIDNPVFASRIKNWLKVMRKQNAMVVFATQSVEDASKSAISDTLVQQTATQIFLPNLKATQEYKKVFMLSDREFDIIKNTDPSSRFFIIKQDNNSVVTRIDLTGMEDVVSVLSGRVETVSLLDKIREKYGDSPSNWLNIFIDASVNNGFKDF